MDLSYFETRLHTVISHRPINNQKIIMAGNSDYIDHTVNNVNGITWKCETIEKNQGNNLPTN